MLITDFSFIRLLAVPCPGMDAEQSRKLQCMCHPLKTYTCHCGPTLQLTKGKAKQRQKAAYKFPCRPYVHAGPKFEVHLIHN